MHHLQQLLWQRFGQKEEAQVVGTANEFLAHFRPMNVALSHFLALINGTELVGDR